MVSHVTLPGITRQICVALSQKPWIPELPQLNVPVHGPAALVLVHAFEPLDAGDVQAETASAARME